MQSPIVQSNHLSKKNILLSSLLHYFYLGNYCYGFCALGLTIEADLQQKTIFNHPAYFVMIFTATILYYTYPYIRKPVADHGNIRVQWYNNNQTFLIISQLFLTCIFIISAVFYLSKYFLKLIEIDVYTWCFILIFPLAGILYYGGQIKILRYLGLRKTGWLKPFVIGFVWAGLVTIYPIIFSSIENDIPFTLTLQGSLLFIKNFMFCSILGIIGDIKDYRDDKKLSLETFVVRNGLFKTLFFILLPLSIIGLGSFVYYGATHQFHPVKIILNVFPFILLMVVIASLRTQKPILYFFAVADGLLIAKCICGIIAMVYF